MKYAQDARKSVRVVRSVAELRMALDEKARGQRIAQLRKRKRLTQQAMAERLRIGYRTYQTWESGTLPEWHNLEKLAKFHGVKPEHILGEDAEPPRLDQLDRIEEKIDAILVQLGISVPDLQQAIEQELEDAGEQDEQRDDGSEEDEPEQPAAGQ